MWPFHERTELPPDEGDQPDRGEARDEEGGKSSHGLSADRIELIEKLATIVIGAIEPVEKLVEVLTHMH